MLVVAALGGNALLRRGEPLTHVVQQGHLEEACDALAPLAVRHRLVLTHGNGPQVGLLALEDEGRGSFPLDVLGAETQGMIGYLLERELRSRLPTRAVVTLLTQVVVDPDDPAFARPSKPVGPLYSEKQAAAARARGFTVEADGKGLRRVVASPQPLEIVELDTLWLLLDQRALVICGGGGGIPVSVGADGRLHGIEAVIDKDLLAALLAEQLRADLLLILTDVPAVMRDWGTEDASPIEVATPVELRELEFADGSMGPKVEAACRFVERTGGEAVIGALADAATLAEAGGTRVVRTKNSSRRRGRARARQRRHSLR